MKKTKLYLKVTKDHLELPLAVAASPGELARMTGTTEGCILTSISHGRPGWVRVELDEEELDMAACVA